jgi:hypothetical protein
MSDVSSRISPLTWSARGLWRSLGYGAFLLVAALVAYWKAFSSFPPYDDEGYVLLSLREFLRLGGLYSHVYSQYGPFPYELWGAVYKVLGTAVTPDNARGIVILVWLLSSLLVGLAAERVADSLLTGLIAAVAAFAALGAIVNEVLIPDDLTTLLAILLIAVAALAANHTRLRHALIGVCVGALLMTKVNIGGAVFLASCLAIAGASPALAGRREIPWGFAALGVVMALVVTGRDLSASWAENLAVLVALGALGVGAAADRVRPTDDGQRVSPPDWLWFIAATLATVIVIAVVIVALGTTPGDLVHGVVVGPLGQRNAFSEPAVLPTVTVDLAVSGLVCALVARRAVAGVIGPLPAGLARVVIGVLILLWASSALPFTPNPDPTTLGVALPFAWLVAAPPAISQPRQRLTRLLMAAVPVYAAIGIYPVAGSQTAYATAIFLPAAAVIMADGVGQLRAWSGTRVPGARPHPFGTARLIGIGLLAVLGYQLLLQPAVSAGNGYADSTALRIAGATRVRLPAATAAAYTGLTDTLRTRCDQFLTLPGMDSFYLWADRVPPTGDNVTAWMFLLSDAQQQRIVDSVQHVRRLCLVSNPTQLANWEEGRTPPARPLYRFVTGAAFKPIYSAGGYTIARHLR